MSRRYKPYTHSTSQKPGLSHTPEALPTPQLHSPPSSGIDPDTMAKQTISYMNVMTEHAAAIRTYPRSEGAYQRIMDQGRVQPPETKWPSLDCKGRDNLCCRMETIIHRSATSAEDHLEICCAAHTLLLLQHDILNHLPYAECRVIEEKTNELIAARRQQRAATRRQGRFHGLVRPPPLPPVKRPSAQVKSQKITSHVLDNLLKLSSQPAILSQKFHLCDPSSDIDTFYQIRSVEISSDGLRFGVQPEGSRVADIVSEDELKDLLENSAIVSTD